jgi:heme exporter protein C
MKPLPKALTFLTILSFVLFLGSLVMIFYYAPLEAVMNYVQKVFYFHISNAWIGLLGFIMAAVSGVFYLVKKDMKWDIYELSAVEISLVFFLIAIVLGSIWAKPTWGTFWTWDPRLTSAAILEILYLAYLLLRQGIEDPERRARFSAVYTLIGVISVPITYVSIILWRTIHPKISLAPAMLITMFFCLATFSVIFVTLFWHRVRLGRLADEVNQLKIKMMQ